MSLLDPNSTHTISSKALLKKIPELQKMLRLTGMGFFQVVNKLGRYHGILLDVQVQMDKNIIIKANIAVVDIPEPYQIVVPDILGGTNSLLYSLNNSDFCCILIVDNVTGNIGSIHYMKNIEHTLLLVVPPLSKIVAAKTEPEGI